MEAVYNQLIRFYYIRFKVLSTSATSVFLFIQLIHSGTFTTRGYFAAPIDEKFTAADDVRAKSNKLIGVRSKERNKKLKTRKAEKVKDSRQ